MERSGDESEVVFGSLQAAFIICLGILLVLSGAGF